MRIGIDVSQIVYGTGVSVYTKELVKALLVIDKENEYIFFGGSLRKRGELNRFAASLAGRYTTKFFPFPPSLADFVWNRLHKFKIEHFTGKLDVYHSSDWAQAPSDAFKVTTIHDFAPFKFPRITPRSIISTHKARLKWIVEEVDRVIVPSEATKSDLVELGMGEERIRVIYEAPEEVFRPQPANEVKNVLRKYKINDKYIMSIGIGGRKNTERAIKAFDLARAGKNLTYILLGNREAVDERRSIRYLGMIETKDVASLLTGAEALLYPSLYEGFGLPILQAFICGCPVVTSNVSCMPEIAGEAAILVDPYLIDSIVEGIKKALAGRKGLIKKGFERVKDFSWEKNALETLNVYREAKK